LSAHVEEPFVGELGPSEPVVATNDNLFRFGALKGSSSRSRSPSPVSSLLLLSTLAHGFILHAGSRCLDAPRCGAAMPIS
jgi:hypothetical protein